MFLPGVAEINKVATLLSSVDARIIALHGGQSGGRQDEALMAGSSRRVVLATSVAESSLTVPGVRVVVDAGLSREPRVDHVRGLGSLVTVSSSRASAEQRAGRSAREAPGTVYRCWAEVEHERLRAYADPEIAVADVTGAVLQLAAWGSVDGSGLALLDQLPAAALAKASELLRLLGAIDADGKVTARGRRLVSVGAHPRLARALLDGADHVGADVASETVALLSMDGRYPDDDVDVCLSRLRHGSDRGASAAWRKEVSRLARSLDGAAVKRVSHGAGLVLGLAYPERVARSRRHGAGGFLMTGGTAAEVRDGSALSGQEWIVVAEADRQPGRAVARVRLAASIDEATARLAASGMEEMVTSCSWVEGSIQSSVEHRLGAVVLSRKPGPELTMEQRARMWRNVFNDDGLGMLSWTNTAVSLRERLTFCHEWLGGEWPDVSDSVLIDRFDEWLLPDLVDVRRRAQVSKIDVASALRRLLPWRLVNALDEVAPERLRVPSGSRLRVDYADPRRPVLAGKLQEFFGMTANPQLAGGRATVVVHLLSPAGRPAAITSDLMSFWDDGYRQVRSELRGRYPKHPWPQDPRTASATAKTKRAAR